MPEQVSKVHPDLRVVRFAERRHGVVSRAELLRLGLTRHQIDERRRRGLLHSVHRGVYSVGQPGVNGSALVMAALLACGDGAVVSHRSAAAIWCIRPSASRRVELTVDGPERRRKGIIVHRNQLSPTDTTVHDGFPITTPARTLIDLADVLPRRALERACDEAEYLRLDCRGLRPIPGRTGYGRLVHVLKRHEPGTTRTRTRLEDRFLELCDAYGLPRPAVNAVVDGKEVDCLFREANLIVEVDGDAAHRTKKAFESDRVRDAKLTVEGYRVIRITEERLQSAPAEVAGQLRALTAGRPTRAAR